MAAPAAFALSGAARPRWLRLPGGRDVALGWGEVGREDVSALFPAEREDFAKCRTPKRREELLAGRLAARRALALLEPGRHAEVSARTEGQDSGRPFFVALPEVALSLSHSHGLAVAAVARGGALGVDLERTVQVSGAFQEEAFAPGEPERYVPLCAGRMDALTAAWALKEAVLKVWGVGLRAPLQLVAVRPVLLADAPEGLALGLSLETGGLPLELGPPPRELTALLLGDATGVLALAG